jgi:hypothetical protein
MKTAALAGLAVAKPAIEPTLKYRPAGAVRLQLGTGRARSERNSKMRPRHGA